MKEVEIEDLIPLVGTDQEIEVNLSKNFWHRGRIVGIDLPDKKIKVAISDYPEEEGNFYAQWYSVYFQLNKNFKRRYYIKLV